MPCALTADGSPLFLVSSMAVHTQNLIADPRASLLVMQSGSGSDPLGSPRATLLGRVLPTSGAAKDLYLARHPSARHWIDYSDFEGDADRISRAGDVTRRGAQKTCGDDAGSTGLTITRAYSEFMPAHSGAHSVNLRSSTVSGFS